MERSFRVIEGGPFLYGDDPDPENPACVETFEINAYMASEGMYGCFDTHVKEFDPMQAQWDTNESRALMFSVWCHGRLPDEHQWEAAVRGKVGILDLNKHWKYGFEGGEDQLADYADINRHAWGVASHIGKRFPTTQSELYDVHGLLWEWMSNIYDFEVYSFVLRVLRGGSFDCDAVCASCSFRNHDDPSLVFRHNGVRVSRAYNP